jgi:hypothetical protein
MKGSHHQIQVSYEVDFPINLRPWDFSSSTLALGLEGTLASRV